MHLAANKSARLLVIALLLFGLISCNRSSNDKQDTSISDPAISACSSAALEINLGESIINKAISQKISDCYNFKPIPGQIYTLTLLSHSGDTDLALASDASFSNAHLLDFSENTNTSPEIIQFVGQNASDHYIKVYGYLTSSYTLHLNEGTNSPPIAVASWPNQSTALSSINLDASNSYDLNNDALSYHWTLTEKPTGSTTTLLKTDQIKASFIADVVGAYEFTLVVNDGSNNSLPVTGMLNVTANHPPIAKASWDEPAIVLQNITLDASNSTDADGHQLTYEWLLTGKPVGSNSNLSNQNQQTTSFTPDKQGNYAFSLFVNDGFVNSETITHNISVKNNKPIAVTVEHLDAALEQTILLDASNSSDIDGHSLSYRWQLLSKPATSSLSFMGSADATIHINADVFGEYKFQLNVSDSIQESDPVFVTVLVEHRLSNIEFSVTDAEYSAALDQLILVSAQANTLYSYKPLDNSLTQLKLNLAPTAISISPNGLFAAVAHNAWVSYIDLSTNQVLQTYPIQTLVRDVILDGNGYIHVLTNKIQGRTLHSINIVTGLITSSPNSDFNYTPLVTAKLHPDGTSIYLAWHHIIKFDISSGTGQQIHKKNKIHPNQLWISEDGKRIFSGSGQAFKATPDITHDLNVNGYLENTNNYSVISLSHSSESASVAAIIESRNNPQTDTLADTNIHFYDYQYLAEIREVNIPKFSVNGSSYHARGKMVFYNSDGTQYIAIVKLDDSAPESNKYGILTSAPLGDLAGINKAPTANPGINQAVIVNNSVTLDGSQSSDSNGDILSYNWEMLASPHGSSAALTNPVSSNPILTPDIPGQYTIGLSVSDGTLSSAQNTVVVTATQANEAFSFNLDYNVTDAGYSESLDRIVTVSATDRMLFTFDTNTYQQTQLLLHLAPTSVSVSPDGLHAAVGHQGWVSYIDLAANNLVTITPSSISEHDVIIDDNNHAYALSMNAILHPNNKFIYAVTNSSYSQLLKYAIQNGEINLHSRSTPTNRPCKNIWVSEDGLRLFDGCGRVLRSSLDPAIDMTLNGSLTLKPSHRVISLDHSQETQMIAALTRDPHYRPGGPFGDPNADTQVYFYNYDLLTPAGALELPNFPAGMNNFRSHGRYIFYNNNGSRFFVITQADYDSGLLKDFGIYAH